MLGEYILSSVTSVEDFLGRHFKQRHEGRAILWQLREAERGF
jgi:hypothetical protein